MSGERWRRKLILTVAGWAVGLMVAFPVLLLILTSLKTETEAISRIPHLFFHPTFASYLAINSETNYFHFAWNSAVLSLGSTLLALLLAIPAAYSMAFRPTQRTRGVLLWMLSTKMMPSIGVLVPIYLLFRDTGLLDTLVGLLMVDTLANLPIVVWMLYTFFQEVPREVLEAARVDGAGAFREVWNLLLPLSLPGIVSTSLLMVILTWNEAFWSLTLTASKAAPLTAFIASFSSPEGLFYAQLSAASTMAIAPILLLGWLSQRQLVRGLTFGAVK